MSACEALKASKEWNDAPRELLQEYFVHYRKAKAVLTVLHQDQYRDALRTDVLDLGSRLDLLPEISLLGPGEAPYQQALGSTDQRSMPSSSELKADADDRDDDRAVAMVTGWSTRHVPEDDMPTDKAGSRALEIPDKASRTNEISKKKKWYADRQELFALQDDFEGNNHVAKSGG